MVVEDPSRAPEELEPNVEEQSQQEAEPNPSAKPEVDPEPVKHEAKSRDSLDEALPDPPTTPERVRSPSISFSTDISTDEVSRKPKSRNKKPITKREARLKEALATQESTTAPAPVTSEADGPESLPDPALDLEGKVLITHDAKTENDTPAVVEEIAAPEPSEADSSAEESIIEDVAPQVDGAVPESFAEIENAAGDKETVTEAAAEPIASDAGVVDEQSAKSTSDPIATDVDKEAAIIGVVAAQPDADLKAVAEEPASKESVADSSDEATVENVSGAADDLVKESPSESTNNAKGNDSTIVEETLVIEDAASSAEPSTTEAAEAPNEPAPPDFVASQEASPPVVQAAKPSKAKSSATTSDMFVSPDSTYIDATNGMFVRPSTKSVSKSKKAESLTYDDLKTKGSIKRALNLAAIASEAPKSVIEVTKRGYVREAASLSTKGRPDDADQEQEDIIVQLGKQRSRHDSAVAGISKEHKQKHRSSRRASTSESTLLIEENFDERRRKHHHREHDEDRNMDFRLHTSSKVVDGSSPVKRHKRGERSEREVDVSRSDGGSTRDRRGSKTSEEVVPPLRRLLSGIKKEIARSFNPEVAVVTPRGLVRPSRK